MPVLKRSPARTLPDVVNARAPGPVHPGRRLCIAVVSNTAWNLFNFRLNLMRALQADGHRVIAVAPPDRFASHVQDAGFDFEPVAISARGVNPLTELAAVAQLWRVFRRRRVDLVLSYTPKGNLYSALAAIACGSEFIPNVSGLGRAFTRRSPVTWVALLLYRLTFRRASHVFFQNHDDLAMFVETKLVRAERSERIAGSGVDLQRFTTTPLPAHRPADAPVFLLVARLLWDKGVGEFVAAARHVRALHPGATFRLLGDQGSENPAAIPASQLQTWVQEGTVTYLGSTDDVRPHMADADCVVLPSYREGVPRVLLEAAAMGRPVITTDAVGCREAVRGGVTGFLCPPADSEQLAISMLAFVRLTSDARRAMGLQARAFVEERFDERIVMERYCRVVAQRARGLADDGCISGVTNADAPAGV